MRWLPLCLILTLFLVACGGEKTESVEVIDGGDKPKVIADWTPPADGKLETVTYAGSMWYGHAPVWVGMQKGFFKDAGFEVIDLKGGPSADRVRLLAVDEAQFSSLGEVGMLTAMNGGEKNFYWIGNQNIAPGNEGVVARKGISSIKDLKGKKVALAKNTSVHLTMADLLKQEDLSINDIEVVPAQENDIVEMLSSGSVDAGVIWEPFFTELQALEGVTLLKTDKDTKIYKDFNTMSGPDVICISKKWYDADKTRAKAFFKAYFKAVQWCADNPEELITLCAKHVGKADNLDAVRGSMQNFVWLGWGEQIDALEKLRKQSAAASALIIEMGDMKKAPKVENWINIDIYRE